MSSVPVIDFTAFGNGTKQERAELANLHSEETEVKPKESFGFQSQV